MSEITPDQFNVLNSLVEIGAIQFGQFERRDQPGTFSPVSVNLRIVPSYPNVLQVLANEIAPLVKITGITHLLAAPSAVPLGTAVSLITGLPLVYPTASDPQTIEGAYDFNEPTVLLTDVIMSGDNERALVRRVMGLGLDVKVIVTVIDFDIRSRADDLLQWHAWQKLPDLLPRIATPSMQLVVQTWLDSFAEASDHRKT
ncbi:MAG: hypothetical protein ABI947_19845 [Chloroflexota bacterium]